MASRPRPGFIVVFDRPSETNAGIVASALSVKQLKQAGVRASVTTFATPRGGGARPRVYHRLGVATASLDAAEVESLRQQPGVAAVVRNELRRIPPVPELSARGAALSHGAMEPLEAYLRGMRDAADAALSFGLAGAPGEMPGPGGPATAAGATVARPGDHSWCLDMIGVPRGYATASGRGVRVAVLDTGLDLDHPDLAGRVQAGVTAESFVPDVATVQDGNGHGTHCAGIVAGPATSTGCCRYGAAPDAELLVGKVLDDDGSGYDDWILEGIDWAADQGADIISMSLGASRGAGQPYAVAYERIAANLLAGDPGVLLIAAAGNDSSRPWYVAPVNNPAACPSLMGIAAVDRHRRVASFSCATMDSIGEVDLCAPGVAVLSAWTGGGFKSISGTSMATPYVAGVAALHREVAPNLPARELWQRLVTTASDLGDPANLGAGVVQAP